MNRLVGVATAGITLFYGVFREQEQMLRYLENNIDNNVP